MVRLAASLCRDRYSSRARLHFGHGSAKDFSGFTPVTFFRRDCDVHSCRCSRRCKHRLVFGNVCQTIHQPCSRSIAIMKKIFVCLALAAGTLAAPALSFAQSNGPVTRAEVRADLVRLESGLRAGGCERRQLPCRYPGSRSKGRRARRRSTARDAELRRRVATGHVGIGRTGPHPHGNAVSMRGPGGLLQAVLRKLIDEGGMRAIALGSASGHTAWPLPLPIAPLAVVRQPAVLAPHTIFPVFDKRRLT